MKPGAAAQKPAVLVVEDEPLLRRMASDIIDSAGWIAIQAANADEALRALTDRPDVKVLFTDAELGGGVSGIDLVEQVHRARPDIELVVTSARGSLSNRALPDDGTLLRKPFRIDDLVRVLRHKLC